MSKSLSSGLGISLSRLVSTGSEIFSTVRSLITPGLERVIFSLWLLELKKFQ